MNLNIKSYFFFNKNIKHFFKLKKLSYIIISYAHIYIYKKNKFKKNQQQQREQKKEEKK